ASTTTVHSCSVIVVALVANVAFGAASFAPDVGFARPRSRLGCTLADRSWSPFHDGSFDGRRSVCHGSEYQMLSRRGSRREQLPAIMVRSQPGRTCPPDYRVRPLACALISSNLALARSNLSLNSHIASRISRKVAEVLARSALPKVKMLLLRRYP